MQTLSQHFSEKGQLPDITDQNPVFEQLVTSEDSCVLVDDAMARHIRAVLDEGYWKVAGRGGAEEILNIKPSTFHFRMKELGISEKTKTSNRYRQF